MAQRMGRPTGRSGAYNRRNTRDMAYIGGTAAPKLEPEYRPERKAPVRRKKTGLHQNQQLRRNRERAMAMDLPYVFLLAAAVFVHYIFVSAICTCSPELQPECTILNIWKRSLRK